MAGQRRLVARKRTEQPWVRRTSGSIAGTGLVVSCLVTSETFTQRSVRSHSDPTSATSLARDTKEMHPVRAAADTSGRTATDAHSASPGYAGSGAPDCTQCADPDRADDPVHDGVVSRSAIAPPYRDGPRYGITLAVVGIVTVAGTAGLVVSDKHEGQALWVAAVVSYLASAVLLVFYRDAFLRVNHERTPSWAWLVVGVTPVIGIGFLPTRSSWPVIVFSAFLGVLMGTAIINPVLRREP